MESWKSHVRVELFHRDCRQKEPFSGLFHRMVQLEEMLDSKTQMWLDRNTVSSKENGKSKCPDDGASLHLKLEESGFVKQKLQQKVAELTSTVYLKEAELQYCNSQMARYRAEAVKFARGASSLKMDLEDYKYMVECQSKEVKALRLDLGTLREELASTVLEKEQFLERWLEEKKEEAERINKHNDTQERWHRLAGRIKKRYTAKPLPPCVDHGEDPRPVESEPPLI